jgi:hypothetical protein
MNEFCIGGACGTHGNGQKLMHNFGVGGQPERKRPPGRPTRNLTDKNKINIQDTERDGMDWIPRYQVED